MKFITSLLITAVAVYLVSKLLNPHVVIESFGTAVIFALVLAFLNAIVKPLIIILTLPVTVITLGLFLLVINVLIILLADHFVSGINISGFFWALIFAFLVAVISAVPANLLKNSK